MLPARKHEMNALSFFIPALGLPRPDIRPPELGTLFAIYGAGFVVLFLMFGLLYLHAYRKRGVLGLSTLEVFDVRASGGEHLVSAGVGTLATLIAIFAPPPYPVFSGFTYFLMGPAHWIYGVKTGKRRKALQQQLTQSSTATAVV